MRIGDNEPSAARRCAQLRQQIRLAACVHEDKSQIIRFTLDGGFIEYCSDCMRVTDVHDPYVKNVANKKSVLANSFRNGLQNADKT